MICTASIKSNLFFLNILEMKSDSNLIGFKQHLSTYICFLIMYLTIATLILTLFKLLQKKLSAWI